MTLHMKEQEIARDNFEKGRLEGIVEGIKTLVISLRELNIPDEIILQKIMEKYSLDKQHAEKYLE